MHIILTHAQADFDALASMLGAYLLDESAIPVLPKRINRNVRAFTTLYGRALPFIEADEVPNKPVETVTLVDTQSLTSVKGMKKNTRIYVVDHHALREDLPAHWTVKTEELGATTTLFVEALQDRRLALSVVQSTLLLLGIYEDTGSLTYTRTTVRDIRAAAYLLEQGASLKVAADFLEHPLSLNQQDLYDRLRAAAETHRVHGHTVVVACADASQLDEEISTIAHKLRDLLDPEALFLIAKTRSGVQLIARSTSDHIDVALIAAHFNGGGHERAAAALIRAGDTIDEVPFQDGLAEVRAELLRILPRYIRPAIRVAQIMSRGLQVITPDTRADEAAQRMQRYGHEGYPVVEDGKVIGLLTRRAVDRAMSHELIDRTAANMMDAGEVTVQPDDPIEHLQNLMIDTSWGQVPVVHPETGEIIGIVTRTDLIKTLAPEPNVPGYQNFAERLESALPPARLALLKVAARTAYDLRAALFIVGGFVRDLLLEHPSLDFDLVVEGDAISLARRLSQLVGGRMTSHARFGTAKWHLQEDHQTVVQRLQDAFPGVPLSDTASLPGTLDLVSARTEFYTHPTALPTVERGSIKLDLHRRDFTINTLALRLDGRHYGELHDYWGGFADLQQGLVRVLHSLSFVDDPTRMLRAVRFEQRFGFTIENRTLELLAEARPLLDRVSGERVRHELDAILAETHATKMLARLDSLALLAAIHPALHWDAWVQQRLHALVQTEPDPHWDMAGDLKGHSQSVALSYLLWLIRLPQTALEGVIKRLRFSSELTMAARAASQLWQELPELVNASPSVAVSRLEKLPQLSLYAVYLATSGLRQQAFLETYLACWKDVTPSISGHDLRNRGLPPGPIYKQILRKLRNAWLDGEITTPAEEQSFLEKLLAEP